MNAAAQGEQALKDSNAPLAIQHYTRALVELPRAVNYYIQRSTAHSRVKPADGGPNSLASLQDAELALFLARERGKRELILAAQMRRGVSLFQLGRYHDAKFLFDLIQSKTQNESETEDKSASLQAAMSGSGKSKKDGAELQIWQMQVARKLKELGGFDEKAVEVVEFPNDTKVPTEKELKSELENLKAGKTAPVANESKKRDTQPVSSAAPSQEGNQGAQQSNASSPIVEKVRHEWYQSSDSVVVTLYIKGVQKDSVQVDLKDESASLQFPLPSGSDYDFTLDPLFAPINPSTSKVSVMGTKIELVLQKQTAGQKWRALESSAADKTQLTDRPAAPSTSAQSGPAYPTSSRHGAKDWDKVASSLTSSKSKGKKKSEADKTEGDASDAESVDSDAGGDAVDGFFKKLYAGADPDTRRAMMKSYIESEGTSLSTNWSEVGNKKMEVHKS